tara:strand:+ start:298 stop:453 length:156 start_codon:yes stop_codon:yes gene_type:complete
MEALGQVAVSLVAVQREEVAVVLLPKEQSIVRSALRATPTTYAKPQKINIV